MRQTLCWHGSTMGCLVMSLQTGQCSSNSRLFMFDWRGKRRWVVLFFIFNLHHFSPKLLLRGTFWSVVSRRASVRYGLLQGPVLGPLFFVASPSQH